MKKIKFIDLFSGIGGFHIASEIFNKENTDYNLECVFACEINEKARKTYIRNFPAFSDESIFPKDIKNVDIQTIPDFDLLFAGFPCQPFSQAGCRKGLKDNKGGDLFQKIVEIIEMKKPKMFLLENVKGILNIEKGATINHINKKLYEAGYKTTAKNLVINSKDCGIKQGRERVYFLGIREDCYDTEFIEKPKIKKEIEYSPIFNGERARQDFIDKVEAIKVFYNNINELKLGNSKYIFSQFLCDEEIEHKEWQRRFYCSTKKIYAKNKEFIDKWKIKYNYENWSANYKVWHFRCEDMDDIIIQKRISGLRFYDYNNFPTLCKTREVICEGYNYNLLSIEDLKYLQTFPKEYIMDDNFNTSWAQLGNSVTVNVIKQLIRHLLNNKIGG